MKTKQVGEQWVDQIDNDRFHRIMDTAMEKVWPFQDEDLGNQNQVSNFIKMVGWGNMAPLSAFWGEFRINHCS